MATSKQDREEARERLLEILSPGDTVYCVLRHASRSGMTRWIDLYTFRPDERTGKPVKFWLSYNAATLGVGSFDERRECIKVGGCGMDMGFALVYDLGRRLWPDGGPLELSSRFHSRDRRHQEERDGQTIERDGGYLLRQQWI